MELQKDFSNELGAGIEYDKEKKRIVLTAEYEGKLGGAGVNLFLDADKFLDEIARIIPGQLDDVVIAALKGAL